MVLIPVHRRSETLAEMTCHKVELGHFRVVCSAQASFRAGLCKLELFFYSSDNNVMVLYHTIELGYNSTVVY